MATYSNGHIRAHIISCVFMFLGGLGFIGGAHAAGCPPTPLTDGASASISTTCDDLVLIGAGNLQIQSSGVVAATTDIAINNSGSTNSISNYGAVRADIATTADAIAIYNTGTISALNSSGAAIITGTSSSDGTPAPTQSAAAGVANNGGTITTLTNSGTSEISGIATNTGGRYGIGVANQTGTIGTLNNQDSALIKGETAGTLNAFGVFNVLGGTINALNNSGLAIISGKTTGAGFAYGVLNNGGNIATLKNSGSATISAESTGSGSAYGVTSSFLVTSGNITTINNSDSATISAISRGIGDAVGVEVLGSTIGTINNSGSATISGTNTGTGDAVGIEVSLDSTIGTINNSGSATISGDSSAISARDAYGIYSDGTIGTLNNSGTISASATRDAYAVSNDGSAIITTLNNSGTITATSIGGNSTGVDNLGAITTLNNSGSGRIAAQTSGSGVAYGISNLVVGTIDTINNSGSATISGQATGAGYSMGIDNYGTIGSINNSGSAIISGSSVANWSYGIENRSAATITSINNSGAISSTSVGAGNRAVAIDNRGAIGTLTNSGRIVGANLTGPSSGIENYGSIANLTNSGTISGGDLGIYMGAGSSIGTLINTGVISSGTGSAISGQPTGVITTLINSQGGNSASPANTALTIEDKLPLNYKMIINSPTSYGQLAGNGVVGSTAFSFYGSTNLLTSRLYTGVLQGLTTANVGAIRSGTYDNMTWTLARESGSLTAWDLTFTGASLMGTQQSLVNTANALAPVYAMQNAVLVNSFTYDCTLFDVNNVCISVGGRNTQVSAANGLNNTSALLIAAYRPHPNYRIGAYADQNLSVNNAGSTVNLSNNTPLIGIFGAWIQNQEGTGAEVRVSAAYGQKDTTITRQVVGLSEPGSGSSILNSQGAQVTAKYGFGVMDKVIVSPYVGVRYTQNNMNGYTEGASSSVTSPLTYSALNTNATTALAGVGASYRVIPTVTTFASAGVETDTNTSNGTYSATGINGLTTVNFNPNPVRTRPTATVGAYYDIVKNQRFGVTGIYRQEAYQAVSTTTVMATYTIGL